MAIGVLEPAHQKVEQPVVRTKEDINLIIADAGVDADFIAEKNDKIYGLMLKMAKRRLGVVDPREGLVTQSFSSRDIQAAFKDLLPLFTDVATEIRKQVHNISVDSSILGLQMRVTEGTENERLINSSAPTSIAIEDGLVKVMSEKGGVKFYENLEEATGAFRQALSEVQEKMLAFNEQGINPEIARNDDQLNETLLYIESLMNKLGIVH